MLHRYFMKIHFNYQSWRCKNNLLNDYHKALLPLLELSMKEAPLLALDLEMTGLDAKKDQIISIGLIPIKNGQIKLNKGQHKLIKITGSVGQSATIHGVFDQHLQQALSLHEAMLWLLKEAKGNILVAHHAPLDLRFIQQALIQQTTQKCPLFTIDTMRIEHKRLRRKQQMIRKGDLRLSNCRSRYNLPNYDAHNALVDALSCGELLLAQLSKMGGIDNIKVSELIC